VGRGGLRGRRSVGQRELLRRGGDHRRRRNRRRHGRADGAADPGGHRPAADPHHRAGHRPANCLSALPKRLHADAKAALAKISTADTRAAAIDAAAAYAEQFAAYPKATTKITDDLDLLLAFYDIPAEHWKHLRTTNAIESIFATVRLRQRVTKGPGCRAAGVAMGFKLMEAAQARWRRLNAPEQVALVRAGAKFIDGKSQERHDAKEQEDERKMSAEECAA
jgi:hypothetical protein